MKEKLFIVILLAGLVLPASSSKHPQQYSKKRQEEMREASLPIQPVIMPTILLVDAPN